MLEWSDPAPPERRRTHADSPAETSLISVPPNKPLVLTSRRASLRSARRAAAQRLHVGQPGQQMALQVKIPIPFNEPDNAIVRVLKKLGIDPHERTTECDQDPQYTACRPEELSAYFQLYTQGKIDHEERTVLCCFLRNRSRVGLYEPRRDGGGMGGAVERPARRRAHLDTRFALLVEAEHLRRHGKRLARALREAKPRLPNACIEDADCSPKREIDKALVRQLGTGALDWRPPERHRHLRYGRGKTLLRVRARAAGLETEGAWMLCTHRCRESRSGSAFPCRGWICPIE